MKEVRFGKAITRIHGSIDQDKVKESTIIFFTNLEKEKKKNAKAKTRTIREK